MRDEKIDPRDAFGLIRSFLRHRAFVAEGLALVTNELERRSTVHDLSKMLDDEFTGFSRINAAARLNGTTYSKAMHALKLANIDLDRKVLSDIAIADPAAFTEVLKSAKAI